MREANVKLVRSSSVKLFSYLIVFQGLRAKQKDSVDVGSLKIHYSTCKQTTQVREAGSYTTDEAEMCLKAHSSPLKQEGGGESE